MIHQIRPFPHTWRQPARSASQAGDTDWFKLDLKSDQHHRFLLRGADSNSGSLDDPFLELWDAAGTLIDSADGGTLTRDAALGYDPVPIKPFTSWRAPAPPL